MSKEKVTIIGTGPAGLTAAIYAARANLNPLVVEGLQPGGQLTITTDVENYPGFAEGIMGPELMDNFRGQAERFGTRFMYGQVEKVNAEQRPFVLELDGGEKIETETVIIATGASAKLLGIESETKLMGHGVSACATCDGFFFKEKEVLVIGGGDTACEEANFLTKFCSKVYLVHRRDQLRASKIMQQKVFENPKIEVLWNKNLHEVYDVSANTVTGADLKDTNTGEISRIDCQGIFIAIGHKPNTDIFRGLLELDETGYIITRPDSTKTNVPGIYACGDAQDHVYRQAVTAAGTGCMAAIDAERWLEAGSPLD